MTATETKARQIRVTPQREGRHVLGYVVSSMSVTLQTHHDGPTFVIVAMGEPSTVLATFAVAGNRRKAAKDAANLYAQSQARHGDVVDLAP